MENAETIHEVVVVGSGLTGAQACQTLADAGVKVTLVDAGFKQESKYENRFPDQSFIQLRKTNTDQTSLFLGDEFEGIPWGQLKTGAQLTPGRSHVSKGVARWLNVISDSFFPMESLAHGGLGNAWGAGCYVFSENEFEKMGYAKNDFDQAYQTVANRIGITAPTADAGKYTCGELHGLLPSIEVESGFEKLEKRYQQKKAIINKQHVFMGRPSLAMTTTAKENRKAYAYKDMEFWHDNDRSVYRPWMTIDKLENEGKIQILRGKIVLSFSEEERLVFLKMRNLETGEEQIVKTKKVMFCSGVLGTGRIAMRSLKGAERLPLLCNPYTYVPMLNWSLLGKVQDEKKSSMGQMVLFQDPNKNNLDVSMAALFTYRSLLLFRLIKESPLNLSDGRALMQYLAPAMVIAGIHHSESAGPNKFIRMRNDSNSITGDVLEAEYQLSDDEQKAVIDREKVFFKTFRKLGCFPLKKVNPGHGSSIHYAGTLPISAEEKPFGTTFSGRLTGTQNVYIGDGSSFNYLPAKGISFTLMANAHRVAENVIKELKVQ